MAISAGTVAAALTLDTGQFEGALKQSRSMIASLGDAGMSVSDKMKLVGSTMTDVGKTATLGLTAPIVAAGTAAVKTFMGFDDAMRQVRATMNASEEDTARLTQAAKEYGASTSFSASQAANALNYLALAGYDADQAVSALPTVLNLAQAGGLDLAYASDLVTDSMSALGLEMDQLDTFADQLAVTSQKSNTNISQLGQAILTVGATARGLKGGTAELNAELGILADNGIKGAEGGTHLRNVILSLTNPTEEAEKALAKYTQGVYDAEGNLRSLDDILGELGASMAKMTGAERDNLLATIFNKTDLAAAQALIEGTGARFQELTGYIRDSQGAAAEMSATMEGGIGGAFRALSSAAEGAAIAFGEALAPTVQKVAEAVTGVVQGFASLPSGMQSTIATVATAVAAAGPLVLILGKVVTAVGAISAALPAIGAALTGPVGLVALGVAGATALAVALSNVESGGERVKRVLTEDLDPEKTAAAARAVERARAEVDQEVGVKVDVEVDPQVTVKKDEASTLYKDIYDWLTDGMPDTETQKEDFNSKVNEYYDGLIKSVDLEESQAQKDLKAKFEAGKIDYKTYVDESAKISANAKQVRDELNGLRDETLEYIDNYAGASTQTVKDAADVITDLESRAESLVERVYTANKMMEEAEKNAGTADERALDAGYVTGETATASVAAKKRRYEKAEEETEQELADRKDALKQTYEEAYAIGGDKAYYERIAEEYNEGIAEAEDKAAEERREHSKEAIRGMQDDFGQILAAFPEEAEQLMTFAVQDEMNAISNAALNGEETAWKDLSDDLKAAMEAHNFGEEFVKNWKENGFGSESAAIQAAVQQMLTETIDPAALLERLQGTELGEIIGQILGQDLLEGIEGIDTSDAESKLRLIVGNLMSDYELIPKTTPQGGVSLFTAGQEPTPETRKPAPYAAAQAQASLFTADKPPEGVAARTAKAVSEDAEALTEAAEAYDAAAEVVAEASEALTETISAAADAEVEAAAQGEGELQRAELGVESYADRVSEAYAEAQEKLQAAMTALEGMELYKKGQAGDLIGLDDLKEDVRAALADAGFEDVLDPDEYLGKTPEEISRTLMNALSEAFGGVSVEGVLDSLGDSPIAQQVREMLQADLAEGAEGVDASALLGALATVTSQAAEGAGEQMKSGGQSAASLFTAAAASGVTQAAPSVAGAAGNMGAAAVSRLKSAGFNFATGKTAAAGLGDGLVSGINSAKGRAVAAMASLANAVNAAFRGINMMASPSKLYRQYGQMIGDGLVLGLDDSVFETEAAVKRLTGTPERVAGKPRVAAAAGPVYNINLNNARIESEEDARDILRRTTQFQTRIDRGRGA